jgi:hypothetical protein
MSEYDELNEYTKKVSKSYDRLLCFTIITNAILIGLIISLTVK